MLWCIFDVDWIDQSNIDKQQRLLHLHQIHRRRVDRVKYLYALVHILSAEWRRREDLVLLVGERKRGVGAVGWWRLVVVVYFEVNFHPFAASLCFVCWLSVLAGVQKIVIFAGENSTLNYTIQKMVTMAWWASNTPCMVGANWRVGIPL